MARSAAATALASCALVASVACGELPACPAAAAGHRRATDAGDAALAAGDAPLAAACYAAALEHKPGFPMALLGIGEVAFDGGDARGGADSFARAAEAWPQYALAHKRLGDARLEVGEVARAVDAYEAAVAADRLYVLAWEALAQAHAKRKKGERVELTYRRALLELPDNPGLHFGHAVSLHTLGRHQECLDAAEKACSLAPT